MNAIKVAAVVCLAGCAPTGSHFEGLSIQPNDLCRRSEVASKGNVWWLNSSIGKKDGIPRHIVAIEDARSEPLTDVMSRKSAYNTANYITCRATLVFDNGQRQTGILQEVDPGGQQPMTIRWVQDYAQLPDDPVHGEPTPEQLAARAQREQEARALDTRCNDPTLLDAIRREIAERYLNEAILHTPWWHTGYRPSSQTLLCYGILPMVGSVNYGWRTYEGQTYVVWELRPS